MTSIHTEQPKENIVRKITTPGYRHHRVIPMLQMHEDKELHLPMVILTGRENAEVEAKAYQDTLKLFNGKCPKLDEPSNWDAQLEAQRAYWTIYYSIRLPDDLTKKWFESKTQVEDTYNWDEAGIFMNDHITVRMTQPHLVNLDSSDPESFQKMLDTVKSMGSESDFFLNGVTTYSLIQFMKSLVVERETLLKNNGSSGAL